jgi:DNA helicase-2/ATP-dependent DNA helicase PcrA
VNARTVNLVLGGPGAGKTSHFIGRHNQDGTEQQGIIGKLIDEGYRPNEIAYVSFTRKAADEAAERAMAHFGYEREDLPHFRTLHSMAFQQLGLSTKDVMQRSDYKEGASMLGVTFTGYIDPADGPALPSREGDLALQWINYAKAKQIPLKQVWQESGEAVEWALVKLFDKTLSEYKSDMGKLDFADMLDRVIAQRLTCPAPVVIIDEAQDLSPAQWAVARTLFRSARRIWFAADDDQAIHEWAGADVSTLFTLKAEQTVLPVSHRLPKEVFELATTVARRIHKRFKKDWNPASHSGQVLYLPSMDSIDLRRHLKDEGTHIADTWMLLARNACFLEGYEAACLEQGVPYATVKGSSIDQEHIKAIITWERLRQEREVSCADVETMARFIPRWKFKSSGGLYALEALRDHHNLKAEGIWHDALSIIPLKRREYYAHCLRNGYRLQDKPRVYIGTIHSVKGGEADNVIIKTDMTYRTAQGREASPDPEHRVWYTGITRAKKNLFIIDAQGAEGYLI